MSSPSNSDPALLINQLPVTQEWPIDPKQLREQLTLFYRRISNTVNTKAGGLFSSQEFFSSQQYSLSDPSTFQNVYRTCFDMVAKNGAPIAPGATVTVTHGITGIVQIVQLYGGAKNSDAPAKLIPLPFVSVTAVTQQVQIFMTTTTIVLINGSTQSTLTSATLVAEYLKAAP